MNDLEQLCLWMASKGLATGHADTMSEALQSLDEQWRERCTVPKGYVVVPVEPTSDMIQAAYMPDGKYYTAVDIYKAMLSATREG